MERIKINGLYLDEYEPFDEKVVKIDAWYDRHYGDWIIEKRNAQDYQVGDCIRVRGRKNKDMIVKELKEEYGIK